MQKTNNFLSFTGGDIATVVNGNVIGNIQDIERDVNSNFDGLITFTTIRYGHDSFFPNNSWVALVYVNEYYKKSSFELIALDKLEKFSSKTSFDDVYLTNKLTYSGTVLQSMTEIPEVLFDMSNKDFNALIERVNARYSCKYKNYLSKTPKNCMAYKLYYWALDNNLFGCKEDTL